MAVEPLSLPRTARIGVSLKKVEKMYTVIRCIDCMAVDTRSLAPEGFFCQRSAELSWNDWLLEKIAMFRGSTA